MKQSYILKSGTSLFASCVIFSLLGARAWKQNESCEIAFMDAASRSTVSVSVASAAVHDSFAVASNSIAATSASSNVAAAFSDAAKERVGDQSLYQHAVHSFIKEVLFIVTPKYSLWLNFFLTINVRT